jgi:hypothetical protein
MKNPDPATCPRSRRPGARGCSSRMTSPPTCDAGWAKLLFPVQRLLHLVQLARDDEQQELNDRSTDFKEGHLNLQARAAVVAHPHLFQVLFEQTLVLGVLVHLLEQHLPERCALAAQAKQLCRVARLGLAAVAALAPPTRAAIRAIVDFMVCTPIGLGLDGVHTGAPSARN